MNREIQTTFALVQCLKFLTISYYMLKYNLNVRKLSLGYPYFVMTSSTYKKLDCVKVKSVIGGWICMLVNTYRVLTSILP